MGEKTKTEIESFFNSKLKMYISFRVGPSTVTSRTKARQMAMLETATQGKRETRKEGQKEPERQKKARKELELVNES